MHKPDARNFPNLKVYSHVNSRGRFCSYVVRPTVSPRRREQVSLQTKDRAEAARRAAHARDLLNRGVNVAEVRRQLREMERRSGPVDLHSLLIRRVTADLRAVGGNKLRVRDIVAHFKEFQFPPYMRPITREKRRHTACCLRGLARAALHGRFAISTGGPLLRLDADFLEEIPVEWITAAHVGIVVGRAALRHEDKVNRPISPATLGAYVRGLNPVLTPEFQDFLRDKGVTLPPNLSGLRHGLPMKARPKGLYRIPTEAMIKRLVRVTKRIVTTHRAAALLILAALFLLSGCEDHRLLGDQFAIVRLRGPAALVTFPARGKRAPRTVEVDRKFGIAFSRAMRRCKGVSAEPALAAAVNAIREAWGNEAGQRPLEAVRRLGTLLFRSSHDDLAALHAIRPSSAQHLVAYYGPHLLHRRSASILADLRREVPRLLSR
jgi:hypothetical protein